MHGAAGKADRESARPGVERVSRPILTAPRSNGIPGPLPVQGDWTDPRWRPIHPGATSELIPFQRPGWVSNRDWDAFRKAVARGSSYTVTYQVRGTLLSLRQYVRHLRAERDLRRESEWWQCELEEVEALEARCREVRARIEKARARRLPEEPAEILQWVEVQEVVFRASSVSYGMRCMVETGRLPGLSWDPERGVVRTTHVQRFCEASE